MNAQQIKALEATQRANETRDQNDAAIIGDMTDDERELLDEAYPSGLAPVPLCLACSAAPALVKAGLFEPISEFDVELELTNRGRRIARRLSA